MTVLSSKQSHVSPFGDLVLDLVKRLTRLDTVQRVQLPCIKGCFRSRFRQNVVILSVAIPLRNVEAADVVDRFRFRLRIPACTEADDADADADAADFFIAS